MKNIDCEYYLRDVVSLLKEDALKARKKKDDSSSENLEYNTGYLRDCLQTHSTIWERPFLPGVLLRFPQAPQSLLQSPEETPRKKSLPHIGKAVCRQSLS